MGWSELTALFIGVLATIAGGIGLKLAENRISRLGTFKIFAEINKKSPDVVYIKFDIINAKNAPYILRDLNLIRKNGDEIVSFHQAFYTTTRNKDGEGTIEKYGEDGSYTFVIPAQDTKQVTCIFMYKTEKFDFKNKQYLIRFFDERGKEHLYSIDKKNEIVGSIWTELKEIKQRKKKTT